MTFLLHLTVKICSTRESWHTSVNMTSCDRVRQHTWRNGRLPHNRTSILLKFVSDFVSPRGHWHAVLCECGMQ